METEVAAAASVPSSSTVKNDLCITLSINNFPLSLIFEKLADQGTNATPIPIDFRISFIETLYSISNLGSEISVGATEADDSQRCIFSDVNCSVTKESMEVWLPADIIGVIEKSPPP